MVSLVTMAEDIFLTQGPEHGGVDAKNATEDLTFKGIDLPNARNLQPW